MPARARHCAGIWIIMSEQFIGDQNSANYDGINHTVARICSFLLAAAGTCALMLNAYTEALRPTHIGVVLVVLIVLQLVWISRFTWHREFTIYACLVGYIAIALLWTRDLDLAMNTLMPAINCILVMIFFGSLIGFHSIPSVLLGALCGFLAGAALYTLTEGFPFSYPTDFPYNAIAGMYLFGLFLALMYSCFRRSNGFLLVALAVVIMLHIVATTSIKTNLGIVLGLVAACFMYFRHFGQLLRRRILTLLVLVCGLGFAIASNGTLQEKMDRGLKRIHIGVQVLQAREDVSGYSAFEKRDYWRHIGIEGWQLNPVFGYGTEAFRDDYGITSHSTPIDLLYNYGLIGFILFYSVFASLIWRLLQVKSRRLSSQRSLMFAGVVCYVFVSFSGTMHYSMFLAAFIGISATLLTFHDRATASASVSSNQRLESQ
jgi:hypothetical protein